MLWFIGEDITTIILGIITRIFIIMVLMPVHEFAHAYAAHKLGDNTAQFRGRLTLNPLAHINWIGAACIMLLGFGWAEPVPVNPYNFRSGISRKGGMALTAAAGPLSNLLMAILFTALLKVFTLLPIGYNAMIYVFYVLQTIIVINLGLAVFNLLPVHPLDGSRIFAVILPDKWVDWMEANTRYITIALFALIYMGAFSGIITTVVTFLYNLLITIFAL